MFEARPLIPDLPQVLQVLTRHGRILAALVAIVAVIPFGAAPALGQTTGGMRSRDRPRVGPGRSMWSPRRSPVC